jgi:hypothetical protein
MVECRDQSSHLFSSAHCPPSLPSPAALDAEEQKLLEELAAEHAAEMSN